MSFLEDVKEMIEKTVTDEEERGKLLKIAEEIDKLEDEAGE